MPLEFLNSALLFFIGVYDNQEEEGNKIMAGEQGKKRSLRPYEVDLREMNKRGIGAILEDPRLKKSQKDVLVRYRVYLASCGRPISTRRSYLQQIKLLGIRLGLDYAKMTKEDLQHYFVSLEEDFGFKERTIVGVKVVIRPFFRWFYQEFMGWIPKTKNDHPPLTASLVIKNKHWIKTADQILTVKDIKKLAQLANNPRDKAIHLVLYESGARAGEFLRMCLKHVQFDQHGALLIIPEGKTVSRTVRLVESVPALKRWIEIHPHRDNIDAPLWITLKTYKNGVLGNASLRAIARRDAKLAGVSLKLAYPHSYRHARATELAKQSFKEQHLRIFFGWSPTSKTPAKYIHMTSEDVHNKILEVNGIVKSKRKERPTLQPKECPRCQHVNSAEIKFCEKCYMALDLKTVMEMDQRRRKADDVMDKLLEDEDIKELIKKKLVFLQRSF